MQKSRLLILIVIVLLSLGLVTTVLAAAGSTQAVQIPETDQHQPIELAAPLQAVNPGFTVDMTNERVFGIVAPGDVVTVSRTVGGDAYGAAEADGVGFFWTPLYDGSGNGQIVGIDDGDTLEIYVNGGLAATISPVDVVGGIDVLTDQAAGVIPGAGAGVPVTVTVSGWGQTPNSGAPEIAVSTGVAGDFSVTFANVDLGAENLVAVDYQIGGNYVRSYLYPLPSVFLVHQYNQIEGYAPRSQNIHASVYITYPSDIRWEGDAFAEFPHGYYQFNDVEVAPYDVVELTFDDSTVISATVADFGNLSFNATLDSVTGDAPTGEIVRLNMWQWQGGDQVYAETHATAAAGSFLAAFGVDMLPRDWVEVAIVDANGNQTHLTSGPPFIDARMDPTNEWDCVEWRVDGPGLPVTLTIDTGTEVYTRGNSPTSNVANTADACYLIWGPPDWTPADFAPGYTVTLQTPSWVGSLVLGDVTWVADIANDAIAGNAPSGDVEAVVRQWNNDPYPINGAATQMTTAASPYTATFTGFDVRDGGSVEVRHFDPVTDFATHVSYWEDGMSYFQVELVNGAVGGFTPVPDASITAWLYDSDGTTLLGSTNDDQDDDPYGFFFREIEGYRIEPGNWITLTSYGYFVAAESTFTLGSADLTTTLNFENSDNVTHLLVENFTGSNGDDLDTNDDGVLDITPWDGIVDCVALLESVGSGDLTYCANTVGPDGSYVPGHVFACPNGWNIGQFDPSGGDDTPGGPNGCPGAATLSINEIRIDQPGTDDDEYFELAVPQGGSLNGLTYLVIGDGTGGSGVIENVTDLSGNNLPNTAGWTAGMQVPDITIDVDEGADLIWGEAPKSLLWIEGGRDDSGFGMFAPVDGYAFDTDFWGHDLLEGDYVASFYQAPSGNRVRQEYYWPQVHIQVNYAHDWVEVGTLPGELVTVTLASGYAITGTANSDGWFQSHNWNWTPEHPNIETGDVVTALAAGLVGTVDPIGVIDILPDFDADTISGTIDAPGFVTVTVRCEIWEEHGPGGIEVGSVDANGGSYFCNFDAEGWDLQPGQTIAVRYTEPDGDEIINVYNHPSMRVNYGHDWVGGDYEAGHTFQITVTESGGAVKGVAEINTEPGGGWGGDGFSTQQENWDYGQQPDIQPGDWVYFAADDGYYNAMHIGEISGTVDVDADSVSGPIYASWFTETLDIECHPWGGPDGTPGKESTAEPDGSDTYFCQWDPNTEWDIEPGQEIAVMYREPDGDRVIHPISEPAPYLRIEKWADANPGEGGNFVFRVQYVNEGDIDAEDVVITDTLLGGMTYITDTSGLPFTGSGAPGDPIVWDVGNLPPGNWIQFDVFAEITASAGEWITNTAEIATSSYNQSESHETYIEWSGEVQSNDTHLNVGKNPWTGDPAPGHEFIWAVNVCNNGGTGSTELTVFDTYPISTTLLGWWGQHPGWTEVFIGSTTLVVSRPSIQGWWCGEVYLRFLLDAAAQPGLGISNTVTITASNDMESDDNYTESWVWVNDPHTNLSVDKWWNWGQLVPGGQASYSIGAQNNGNVPVSGVFLTDTLPVSTTLIGIWAYDRNWNDLGEVTPTVNDGEIVVWEVGTIENGDNANYEIQVAIDPNAIPGTEFVNAVEISLQPNEDNYEDNYAAWVETLFDHGPNLRIRKDGQWDDWGDTTRRASYWLNVENVGDAPVMPVIITDIYDSKMYLEGGVDVHYWRWWDWNDLGGYITVTLESLYGGENVGINLGTITDTEPLPFGLIFTNTAEVTLDPDDVNPGDNGDQVVLTTGPSLLVEKDLFAGEALPGELVTFTLAFGNDRYGHEWWWNMQGDALLTDTLPAGMEYITSTLSWCHWIGEEWCSFPANVDGNELGWHLWPFGTGEMYEIHLTVRITDTAEGGDIFTNWVEIASAEPISDTEAYYDDNTASYDMVVMLPNFEIGKVYESSEIAGTVVTYTLTVTNVGSAAGTNVVLSDTLPAGLTYGGGDGTFNGDDVTWSFASIAPNGGTGSGWFSATLPCSTGTVTNDAYRVVSSDQGVDSDPGAPVSFSVAAPAITADIDYAPATIVAGDTVYFTATVGTNGAALTTFEWDFDDGTSGSGLTPLHVYTADGGYTVAFTATDTCGYSAVQTTTITVNPPALTASFDQSAASALVDATVYFTDTSTTDGAAITAWTWDFGDGSEPVFTQDASHAYAAEGAFTVTLVVTDAVGYSNQATGQVVISFDCIPLTGVSFTFTPPAPLIGAPVTFTASITPPDADPPIIYEWDFADGTVITGTEAVIQHAYADDGTFTVNVTASNACTAGVSYSDAVIVSLHRIYLPIIMR